MTQQREVEPWPAWVRYPLIAVLAVVAVFGMVTFLHSGVDSTVLRIVLVVVLVPLVLTPLQVWGRRRRSRRLEARGGANAAPGHRSGERKPGV